MASDTDKRLKDIAGHLKGIEKALDSIARSGRQTERLLRKLTEQIKDDESLAESEAEEQNGN